MRRVHFARPARILFPPAKPVANVSANSKSDGPSVAEVHAYRRAEGVVGRFPNDGPVPQHTEQLETCDLPRALGSGAARSHKLDEDETTQSEPLTGNLARRDTPLFHIGRSKV